MGPDTGPGERSPDRGASEAVGGVPLDHLETRVREDRGAPEETDLITKDDGAGVAGGSSGATGGSSGTPGHPDAPR